MRTFSHALVTAAIGRGAGTSRGALSAFVAGSVIPDMPLMLLAALSMLSSPSWDEGMQRMHATYEIDALWIALHNLPHSLIALGLLALVMFGFRQQRWAVLTLWFAAGAALHSVIDIFTHAGDGPMFLYPLSTFRFDSPVSYWDPAHYGRVFTVFEYSLDALLILYLSLRYQQRTLV